MTQSIPLERCYWLDGYCEKCKVTWRKISRNEKAIDKCPNCNGELAWEVSGMGSSRGPFEVLQAPPNFFRPPLGDNRSTRRS